MALSFHVKSPLQKRFAGALLIEVEGDRADLAGDLCEVVDRWEDHDGRSYTVLHVPGGGLPAPTRRAEPLGEYDQDWLPRE